jgi:excisionase family DNA binding protein
MREVATILVIPVYSARELGRRGELPTVKIGRRVRVRPTALQRFIEQRENGVHPHPERPIRP